MFCKTINKHPEEKTFLKELIKDGTEEGNKLASMREELNIKQQAAARVASRYVNRVKDTILATDPEKYTREVSGKVIEDWRKIAETPKYLKRAARGKFLRLKKRKKFCLRFQVHLNSASVRHLFTILIRCCGTPMVFYGHGSV